MQAVGNFVREGRNCIFYITSEEFTNEMIDSIRSNKMPDFGLNTTKWICCWLTTSISSPQEAQEEFSLQRPFDSRKQMVLTSDDRQNIRTMAALRPQKSGF